MPKSKSIKQAFGEDGLGNHIRKGEWEMVRDEEIPGGPKETQLEKFSSATLIGMARDKQGGMSLKKIAAKYETTTASVAGAMKRVFVSTAAGREVLKGILLENAIGSGMKLREKIGDMNVSQAVIATSAMTQRFIEMDKHTASAPKEIDFTELEGLGKLIENLSSEVGVDDISEGEIIDIGGDAELLPKEVVSESESDHKPTKKKNKKRRKH